MVSSIDIKGRIDKCTTGKAQVIWYAKIDGKVFINSTGHCFFYRKSDLIRSLYSSPINNIIGDFASNHIEFFGEENSIKHRREVFDWYWNGFVGETEDFRCQICKITLP